MTAPPTELFTALSGRYEIQRPIGVGGMAMVYLARDLRHDRPVALKVLRPELGAVLGPERFLAEIRSGRHRLLDWTERRFTRLTSVPYINGTVTVLVRNSTIYVATETSGGRTEILSMPLSGGKLVPIARVPTAGIESQLFSCVMI